MYCVCIIKSLALELERRMSSFQGQCPCHVNIPSAHRVQRTPCAIAPFSISSFSNRALSAAASEKVGLRRPMRGDYDPGSGLSTTCTTYPKRY